MAYRLLVTGSRKLRDVQAVHRVLDSILADHPDLVVIHGKNESGADWFARRWCWKHLAPEWGGHIREEPHPADWTGPCRITCRRGHRRRRRLDGTEFCPAAGNYRNQEMVDSRPDECVAFFKDGAENIGTTDCVARAVKAGVPVRKYYE